MFQGFLVHEVVNMVASPLPIDQTDTFKDTKVLGHSRLGNPQKSCQSIYTKGIRSTLPTKEFK